MQQYRKKPGTPVKGIIWDGSKEGVHEVAAFLKENDYIIRDVLNRDEGVIYVTIDCHPAICLHISKQSWILIDSEFNLKVMGAYEFSQTYEPVSAPSVQSEGGLQWVKGAPKERKEFFARVMDLCSEDIFEGIIAPIEDTDRWLAIGARFFISGIENDRIAEHLSLVPSTTNTEEERLNKEISGFNTVAERVAYDQGYTDREKVTMQWIEKWDGSTNSGLGELIARKFREQQIAFAEWLHNNRWFTFENGFWLYTFEHGTCVSDKTYNKRYRKTSAQLYELFLTETKQQ